MVTYSERPWTKHYDPGVPTTIQPYPDVPFYSLLSEHARKAPDSVAVVSSAHLPVVGRVGRELTYAQIEQASDAFSAALIALGLNKGDRVAIVMPNVAAFIIAYFAVLKAGGVVAATNPTYPAEKMADQIENSGATFAVTLTLFYKLIKKIQPKTHVKTVIVANVKEYLPQMASLLFTLAKEKKEGHYLEAMAAGDYWLKDLLEQYAGQKANVEVKGSDLAIFQYTGGTTGIPKAAMATHNALVANTMQCRACLVTEPGQDGSSEVFVGAIPFFHVYGLVSVVGFAMTIGAQILLVPNARDINDLLGVIDKYKPTTFMGVPALYNAINVHPGVVSGKISLSSIRLCLSGSAPLPPTTKQEFERLSGGSLIEGYGMSETPTVTHVNPHRSESRSGSIGLPMPDMEIKIVSLTDEESEVPVGEIGELVMTGPQLMVGYHGMPEETDHVLRRGKDGKLWLYSGDIARMDEDGFFYIVDRKKDMALISGFNVYPTSIEKVLLEHPAILECCVAAIPHPEKDGQEALKAWVIMRPGQTVTSGELITYASRRLARYEVPTRFTFVEALPKSTVGKTLRRELVQAEIAEREKTSAIT